jgi:hypothetical protein
MELHAQCDKLLTELDHLERLFDCDPDQFDHDRTELALLVTKRVRRESTLLVRQLAAHRDSYSQEAQANHD